MDGLPVEAWFDDSEIKPLTSVPIAQVHTTRLKSNGKEMVTKVTHPNTLLVIKTDLGLIYRLAHWVSRLLPDGYRLRPTEVMREYKKALIDELNLLRESTNAIQLRCNFEGSPMFYIPEVYPDYCSEGMMVMERIYDIPVSDVAALERNGINMKLLVERGVQVLFTWIFHDSFFHVDIHPGNAFVSYEHPENPKYIGTDREIVGSLNKGNKRYPTKDSIAFFNRGYCKVAELHADSGWMSPDASVEESKSAIHMACELTLEKPLAETSSGRVLLSLFNTARRFSIEVQPQLVLLQKTLLCVEEVGRQLYPQLDLRKTVKSLLESWIKDQVGIPALVRTSKEKVPFWVRKMPELLELVHDSLCQGRYLQHSVDKIARELQSNHVRRG